MTSPEAAPVQTAVIFGVGAPQGLGAALARHFAGQGLHVILAARNAERLQIIANEILAAGGSAEIAATDVTQPAQVAAALDKAEAKGPLELVVYNVGNNIARPTLELEPEVFEALWRQNAFGGFLVGQETVRRLLARRRGTLIFTGATASLRARPPFTGFAAAKAALRAVAQGLAREFGPWGIHVAHVVIDGVIGGEYAAKNFPQLVAAKGVDGLLLPDEIAEVYWSISQQKPSAWTHELDIRPAKESF